MIPPLLISPPFSLISPVKNIAAKKYIATYPRSGLATKNKALYVS